MKAGASGNERPSRSRPRRRRTLSIGSALLVAAGLAISPGLAGGQSDRPARDGRFSGPFEEPTVAGRTTAQNCIKRAPRNAPERRVAGRDGKYVDCKPAAASTNVAWNGKIPYWNALESTENLGSEDGVPDSSIAFEYGVTSINDHSRVLRLGVQKRWTKPTPVDGGANPNGNPDADPLIPGGASDEPYNDGAMFCADQNWLPDGRLLTIGGTAYSRDPGTNFVRFGPTELQGLRNSRIFNPKNDRWTQTGNMQEGRWYPSLVSLPNGDQFVASGVRKLVKPVYKPPRAEDSGRNVTVTETFNSKTGRWRNNGKSAERSLPLFPRLHLLPNGDVYYDGAGQSFNPFGQAVDQAKWNVAASYDPDTRKWSELGIPGLTTGPTPAPGFRGSTFSVALPLKPNRDGRYTKADFLTAGGLASPNPSPGSYFPTKESRIATVDTAGASNKLKTTPTGPMNEPTPQREPGDEPFGRWYSSGTLLPTGEVLATAGADRDEVATPGFEREIKTAEIFDPVTKKWRSVDAAQKPRTYHNTAVLLPDGRVLIGGHAPITTAYGDNSDVPGSAPNGRDPSFEIYSPPYLFRGARPKVTETRGCAGYGDRIKVTTDTDSRQIHNVMLVRNSSVTHVVDGDQKAVELKVVRREGRTLTLEVPPSKAAPPGPYMLFVNKRTPRGLVPSVSKRIALGERACQTFGSSPPEDGTSSGNDAGGDKTAEIDQTGSGSGSIQQDGPGDEYDYHSNGLGEIPAGEDSGLGRTLAAIGLTGLLVSAMLSVARATRRLGWLRRERP